MAPSHKSPSDNSWLTGVAMIAKYFGFGITKTSELIKSERIKSYRVGKLIMVRKVDVDSFIMFEKPFNKLTRPQKTIVNFDE
jgi:excisionase family DNA binding protein